MKNNFKKILAVALTAVMLVGILPTIIFAEDLVEVTSIVITDPPVLNTAYTEKEVRATFADTAVRVDPEAGYWVDPSNSGLLANDMYTYNDTAVDPEKTYKININLKLDSGYDWPAGIKTNDTPDFTGFTVTVFGNSVDLSDDDVNYYYNDYWNSFSFELPLGEVSTSPIVKNVEVTPDRKSVEKGGSYTFEATVSGTAEKTFAWSVVGANSNDTVIDTNGKLTIGEDETAETVTVRATSTVDNTKYDESTVTVLDEAPTMTITMGSTDTLYPGDGSSFPAYTSGTETDQTIEWALAGNVSANTYIEISGYENKNCFIKIGADETAETITITAKSIHYPGVTAIKTITVKQPIVVKDIYVTLEDVKLDASKTEGEMQQLLKDSFDLADPEGVYIDRCYLMYDNNGSWFGISSGTDPVDLNKTYAVKLELELNSGYAWSSKVMESDYSDLSFYLNGKEYEVKEYDYNSYWNSVGLIFVPVLSDAEFTGASLNLGEDLSLNYFVKVHDTEAVDVNKMAVKFTFNERTYLVKNYTTNAQGEYVFNFPGIAPQQMIDTIDAELVILGVGNSVETVLDVKTDYSVKDYCKNVLNTTNDGYLKQLIYDLVEYGSAAQYFTNYRVEGSGNASVNSFIAAIEPSIAVPENSDAMVIDGNTTATCKIKAVGVRYDVVNKIFVKIYSETDAFTVTVDETEYTAADCEDLGENVYKLVLDGLKATELGKVYTIVLNNGENNVTTLEYGAYAYAKAVYDNELAEDVQKDLAIALYRYGKSAKSYVDAQ